MRVYEYAKKLDVSSKELLAKLKDEGFDFASHMSVLTSEAIKFLEGSAKRKDISKHIESKKPKSNMMQEKQISKKSSEKKGPIISKKSKSAYKKEQKEENVVALPKKLIVRPMILADAAAELGRPATDVILTLLKWGIVRAKNQVLTEDEVSRLAEHYEVEVFSPVDQNAAKKLEKLKPLEGAGQEERFPVVVVMGHVDHGKTTLLDFIRKTRVASREKGGITQHLGAYEVQVPQGGVVFLDTPGHEAFSRIRMRGARAADIAVLVVAADDGIMPQTIEAIRYAKSVETPIIVAINKVDRVKPAQIEAVKQQLTKYDLLPEEWGGDVVCVPISAKTGEGVDHLIEMIILQAELMELKADKKVAARGYVLESKMEKGRGPVATLICQHGVAKVGDFFICGDTFGKISSLVDSHGNRISSVSPSIPVQIAGFNALPEAGDFFEVVSAQEYRKAKSGKREKKVEPSKLHSVSTREGVNIIIKADSDSSREALLLSIEKLSKKLEKGFNVISSSVGDINESDIDMAAISESVIYGLHIKAESKSLLLSQRMGVDIRFFDIIYKLMDDLKELSESRKEIKKEWRKVGEAVVLRVFDIKNIGVIAGCHVKDGRFAKGGKVVAYRDGRKVGEGKILSLQREKKTVKEVHAGFECGFIAKGFEDWAVDDRVDCFLELVAEEKK